MPRRTANHPLLERHDPTGVERFACTWSDYQTQYHAHPEYQITLTIEGRGHLSYMGGQAAIPKGCLVILHPGEPHILANADHHEPWMLRSLHIPPHWLEKTSPLLLQPSPILADTTLLRSFDDVWGGFVGQRMEAALARMATVLQDRPGLEPSSRSRSDMVRKCLDILANKLERTVSASELAKSVGSTTAQVRHAVTKATGLPPNTWHLQRRIAEAKHRMAKGGAIAVIALELGFADQAHFTRHFTRLVGVSPSRYAAGVRSRSDSA